MRPPLVESGSWRPSKSRQLPPHTNAGLEVVYVARGELRWQVDGRVEVVPPRSAFFTLPWQRHGSTSEYEPGCELHFAVLALDRDHARPVNRIRFHPALNMTAAATRELGTALPRARQHALAATDGLAWALPRLVSEAWTARPSHDAIVSLARLTLVELGRCLRTDALTLAASAPAERLRTFVARLDDRCAEPWTLTRMAAEAGVSRTRFAELVHDLTGDTPTMLLNRARVRRAQRRLRETAWPVTRVALDAGLPSTQYFARVFRAYTGTTPTAYRARHRGRA